MNNFSDVGRIGKDAVTRFTQGGKSVTGFSLAVDSGYGEKQSTIWLDCSGWGERWEKLSPHLIKGAQVMVNGELGTREHEGKTYITLRLADLRLVGEKKESKPAKQKAQSDQPEDDEIPF